MVPDESDGISMTKEKVLANIDVAMGGHVAEEVFIGSNRMTTGCSSDLQRATQLAYVSVRDYGMFGEDAGYISASKCSLSGKHAAMVDAKVQQILKESKARVTELLLGKDE
jgi:ATP-dependent metalloprotease